MVISPSWSDSTFSHLSKRVYIPGRRRRRLTCFPSRANGDINPRTRPGSISALLCPWSCFSKSLSLAWSSSKVRQLGQVRQRGSRKAGASAPNLEKWVCRAGTAAAGLCPWGDDSGDRKELTSPLASEAFEDLHWLKKKCEFNECLPKAHPTRTPGSLLTSYRELTLQSDMLG